MSKITRIGAAVLVSAAISLFSFNPCFLEAWGGGLGERQQSLARAASEFSLQGLSGKTVSLKDYKGRGIILFFFTTWCPHCLHKLPLLAKEYSHYKDAGIELLAINTGETRQKVASFASKTALPFDILLDGDMRIAEDYDVVGVPTFVLISGDGFIRYQDNDLPSDYREFLK